MILDFTFVDQVQVQTYLGTTSLGDKWATAAPKACRVQDVIELVTNAEGKEQTSKSTLFGPLSDESTYTRGSRVTLPSGDVAEVITVNVFSSGAMNLGLDHIEVHLT